MAKWITFKEEVDIPPYKRIKAICVEGMRGEAQIKELLESKIESIKSLPYPAQPRHHTNEDSCPSFCFAPKECAGRSSCPRSYACSE